MLLERDQSREVVPPEELFDVPKAVIEEQLAVLLEAVGNQHVLERFAFLRDLDLGIAVAALQRVVIVDEEAVERRVPERQLLDQDEAPVLVQALSDPAHDAGAVQRS